MPVEIFEGGIATVVEVVIQGMHSCPRQGLPVLLLKEVDSGKYLNIRLPDTETQLLTCVLVGVPTPYERSCRLLASVLKRHGPLSHVELHFEESGTIRARLGVTGCHGASLLDLHPAEALTLAWSEALPVRANRSLSEQGPSCPPTQPSGEESPALPVDSLPAAFRDFLAQLDLDKPGSD